MLEAVAPPLTPPLRPPPDIALFFSAKKVYGGVFNKDFPLPLRSYKNLLKFALVFILNKTR